MDGTSRGPALPAGFQFSQASLSDYLECPRRFELKYIEQRAWPALVTEPALKAERYMLLGAAFHRMVQSHLAGVDAGLIQQAMVDPFRTGGEEELLSWWQNYLQSCPADLPGKRFVEYTLVTTLAGQRLVAKLDVFILQEGPGGTRCTIIDWKTSKPPRQGGLERRIQTVVYRCLASRCLAPLNNGVPVLPEHVSMIYWFASPGAGAVRLDYDARLYQTDTEALSILVTEISARPAGAFAMTAKAGVCERCIYRSLCGRGVQAGSMDVDDFDMPASESLSLDSVEEIAF